ncbi:MAG: hypothetical protein ACHQF2_01300 [Flavobacteriales bacterium]
MKNHHKFLIISYNFPPDPSVGSRRWAKFAKYLVAGGNRVTVLSAASASKKSPWDQDVQGIKVIRLPQRYPSVLNKTPTSIFEKIAYRYWIFILKLLKRGTIYDRGIFWKKQLIASVKKIIAEDKIDIVIVNGPPHRLIYYTAALKQEFPEVKFWCDLRDPWTWWYNMGYAHLKPADKKFELNMERTAITNMDRVFVPIVDMKKVLDEKYPELSNKIEILPHGFDPDDIQVKLQQNGEKCIRLIYFGSLYLGLDEFYSKLLQWLVQQNGKVTLDIFTSDSNYSDIFKRTNHIRIHSPLSSREIFKVAATYDYFLLVYPEQFKNYFATKFYELVAAKIPIVYVGHKGETSVFIEDKRLGYYFNVENPDFDAMMKSLEGKNAFACNDDFIGDYNFKNLVARLQPNG